MIIYPLLFISHCFCYFFFFFKQNTAYEMRISDWSSDVCSSDLLMGIGSAPRTVSPIHLIRFAAFARASLQWTLWPQPEENPANSDGQQMPQRKKTHR